ncbi:MAG: UDP-2,3-diacylglucosamine diphosphatase [Congregibacter sp.]
MQTRVVASGRCLFISDLHLDDSRPWVISALAEFLTSQSGAAALFVLGDLFEFWVGDDDDSDLSVQVATLFAHYANPPGVTSGPALFFMHGNRDFLIGPDYAARCGATLLDDPTVLTLDGEDILLCHGDALCTRDKDYQAFRKLARSSEWQAQMLDQDLPTRRQLAAQLRAASKDAGSRKADDIMDVTESEVVALMKSHDCRSLVHGHTHRPRQHRHESGERWVLGDWDELGWFLEIEGGRATLESFSILR